MMRKIITISCVLTSALLLGGCLPQEYCSVQNRTGRPLRIEFVRLDGSRIFLPHFQIAPGESRRVTAQGDVAVAYDMDGHLIGRLDEANRPFAIQRQ
jgi:hypothetical protein